MSKLLNEDWLAVINDKLDVVGIVDEKEALDGGNKYKLFSIRVIVVSNNRVCLTNKVDQSNLFDTHISTNVRYNENYEDAFKRVAKDFRKKPKFVLQYSHKTEKINRIVRLYVVEVKDEKLPDNSCDCRFWTRKQIEESIGFGNFNPLFQEEFEFLNATILPVMESVSKKNS